MERSAMLNLFLFIFDPFFPCIADPLTFIISQHFPIPISPQRLGKRKASNTKHTI